MFLYRLFRGMFRILYRFVYRWEIIGLENVPLQGGVMVCSNHKNNLDPPFIASPIERQVHFMAKEELFKIPVISYLVKQFGAYPVKRGVSDKGALRKSLQILKDGKVLGIFPEGTRSKDGKLGKPYPGAALFALKSNAVVIPTAVIGEWKIFQPMRVVYGKPIEMTEFRGEKLTSTLTDETSEKIMQEIQQLIDEYS